MNKFKLVIGSTMPESGDEEISYLLETESGFLVCNTIQTDHEKKWISDGTIIEVGVEKWTKLS